MVVHGVECRSSGDRISVLSCNESRGEPKLVAQRKRELESEATALREMKPYVTASRVEEYVTGSRVEE